MKRSEMVLSIQRYLEREMSLSINISHSLCERLLFDMEKSGMKPPCCGNFGGHGELNENNECNDYVESCNFSWEKE